LSDHIIIEPPAERRDGDDPRELVYVRVGDLLVDTTKQREIDQRIIDSMGEWDWAKFEVPTVTRRPDGRLAVGEGQRRIIRRTQEDPDSRVWVVVQNSQEDEAALAYGITRGRVPHSPFAQWNLQRETGNELQVRAEAVLAAHQVALAGKGDTRYADGSKLITAVAAVRRIMSMPVTLEEGAQLLNATLAVLMGAFPALPRKTFDPTLMKAVAGLIFRNDLKGDELIRLAQKLDSPPLATAGGETHWTPQLWLNEGTHRKPGQSAQGAVTESIAFAFNKHRREEHHVR
jgi:hypothetical protein